VKTVQEFANHLIECGFVEQDQLAHFGDPIKHNWYGLRQNGKRYQYILLVGYLDGTFLEAVYECYHAPKNTRLPKLNFPKGPQLQVYIEGLINKGFWPARITLARNKESLDILLNENSQ